MAPYLQRSLATAALFVACSALVGVVFASSYITSFYFSYNLTGTVRSFDGNNIAFVSSFAKSLPSPHSINKTYTVELRRKKLVGYDRIGAVTLPRDSGGTAKWSNVGRGSYYVYLSKANDGKTLSDDYVQFKNY